MNKVVILALEPAKCPGFGDHKPCGRRVTHELRDIATNERVGAWCYPDAARAQYEANTTAAERAAAREDIG